MSTDEQGPDTAAIRVLWAPRGAGATIHELCDALDEARAAVANLTAANEMHETCAAATNDLAKRQRERAEAAEAERDEAFKTYHAAEDGNRAAWQRVAAAEAAVVTARRDAWDEGYLRGRYPFTREDQELDPIPECAGAPTHGRNANPYRARASTQTPAEHEAAEEAESKAALAVHLANVHRATPPAEQPPATHHEFVLRMHDDPYFPEACGHGTGTGALCGLTFEHPVHAPAGPDE